MRHNLYGGKVMSNEVADLFEKTLAGDYDDDAPWEAVHTLRVIGTPEVFDIAARWLESPLALKRARAADVLAQLGVTVEGRHAFPDESCDLLIRLAQNEREPRPLASAIFALGHIRDPRSLQTILRFATHENGEVRHSVAYALGSFAEEPSSIACLLRLMTDSNDDVRDWATFSLGVLGNADSDEIRAALVKRLEDPHIDTRLEAGASLAKRKDVKVLPVLLAGLEDPEGAMSGMIDAACAMLDLEQVPEGWQSRDFSEALRKRYGDYAS